MGTSVTLTDIESMDRKDVIDALEFIAKKIGYDQPQVVVEAPTNTEEVTHGERFKEESPEVPNAPGAAGIDVDSQGLPWDGRIHSSNRGKIADGTWKLRRGVDQELVAHVLNELRATMGLEPKPIDVIPPLTPPPTETFKQVPPPPFVPPAAPPAPPLNTLTSETPQATIATGASPSEATFPKLMQKITAAFAAKTLDQNAISEAVKSVGLPSLPMLASRPELVPQVAIALGLAL